MDPLGEVPPFCQGEVAPQRDVADQRVSLVRPLDGLLLRHADFAEQRVGVDGAPAIDGFERGLRVAIAASPTPTPTC